MTAQEKIAYKAMAPGELQLRLQHVRHIRLTAFSTVKAFWLDSIRFRISL